MKIFPVESKTCNKSNALFEIFGRRNNFQHLLSLSFLLVTCTSLILEMKAEAATTTAFALRGHRCGLLFHPLHSINKSPSIEKNFQNSKWRHSISRVDPRPINIHLSRKYKQSFASSSCLLMSPSIGKSGAEIIESDEVFVEITSDTSSSRLATLVFFTAPWCGPCRLSNPVVKEIMKQFTGKIDVLEVCTDDLPEVASDAGVVSIPTIQIYHGGKCLDTIVGCVAKNVLANAVQKVLDDIGEI